MSDLIQPEELYQKINSDQPPVVIDVRSTAAFTAGHIPDALHISGEELAARMAQIPHDRPVITY